MNKVIPGIHQYKQDIKRYYKPVTKEEQFELFELYRNKGSKKAYNNIYYSCLNFVLAVANRYKNQGVELEDLVQVGNMALHKSIERFDHIKYQHIKFISYAVNWIRQAMLTELAEQSRMLKIHTGVSNTEHQVRKAVQRLEHELMRTPTPEEVSKRTKIPEQTLEHMRVLQPQPSLDAAISGENENGRLIDTIEDDKFLSPENYILTTISKKIAKFVENSTIKKENHKKVVKYFFALGRPISYNFREIADILQISPERVRQIKEECVVTLKKYNQSQEREGEFHLTPEMLAE